MIPIAKGKFSQPRQPRRDDDILLRQSVQPAAEAPKPPVHDSSMDETMLLTGTFEPIRDPAAAAPTQPTPMVTGDTITFDEKLFMEETASYQQPVTRRAPQETRKFVPVYDDEDEDYRQERYERKESARRQAKNRKILLISISAVTVLLLIAIIAGVMLFINSNKDDGLILNNVTVAGVNIGGMTPEEAAAAIHRATDMTFTVENMMVYLPDTILELAPGDTNARLDVNAAVEAAYSYGRSGTAEENKQAKADSLVSNHTIALLPYLSLDLEYIRGELDEYGSYFNSDYEESSWELDGDKPELDAEKFDEKAKTQTLILKPGKPGRYVDIDKVYADILDAYSMNLFEVRTDMTDEEQTPEALDLEELFELLCSESENASMDMDTFEVTPEVYGYTFDLEKAKELLSQTEYGSTLEIPMEYVIPEVLSADLEEKLFRDELAYAETPHTNDNNRNTNLKLACEAINGMVLMPGDTFDYNKTLGERTEARGYKPAGALQAGTSTTEVGGGICQVSSTLYYACLLSDLEIVTRRSHSLPSTYMPMMGVDATVSWGGPEFRFRNDTNYPIRIEAEVSGGYVKVRLVGTDEKDYYVKMESKIVDVMNPKTVEETYTAAEAKALGYTNGQVKQQPVTGYTVYSYKCKYDKETDKLISRDYEATSNYVSKDKIVIVVEEEPTEAPTETPTTPPTDPPATQPPATDPPATEPPATDPPATQPPAEPPVTDPDPDTVSDTQPDGGSETQAP